MTNAIELPVVLSDNAKAPCYAHDGDAGMDLFCNEGLVDVYAGARVAISTGVHVAIPEGYYGDIRSKSGLALNCGLTCLTGTIDQGYTGEIKVILINLSGKTHTFLRGDKVAQLVITPCARANVVPVKALDETERGTCGFGSTGK
jgi:dUTP pyrophosphatase